MKITKYVHSCLLVETSDRTALFDPGVMSSPHLDIGSVTRLDDIFITHVHPDHVDPEFVKKLIAKFPTVRITTTQEVVDLLAGEGVKATTTPPAGVIFFDSPHENVSPVFPQPEEVGFHYLDVLTDPGDCHSFTETKQILALPITAPWGSAIRAITLAMELKPKYIMPIHDWHWSEEARHQMYDRYEQLLAEKGITMFKPETGQAITIDI